MITRHVQHKQNKSSIELHLGAMEVNETITFRGSALKSPVFWIYVPGTHQFWWNYGWWGHGPWVGADWIARFLEGHVIYVLPDRITVFTGALHVRESRMVAQSFEEASADIPRLVQERAQGKEPLFSKKIELETRLHPRFLRRGSEIGVSVKIASVARQESKWNVVLKNYEGRRATMILSDVYEVLEVYGPTMPGEGEQS